MEIYTYIKLNKEDTLIKKYYNDAESKYIFFKYTYGNWKTDHDEY